MNKIITIDRQFGSGGREIGRRLSEKLGYAYYDHEIISEIAKKTELAEAYVKHIVEHSPFQSFPITIGKTFYHYGSNAVMEQNNTIYTEQRNIILGMAETSDCIIVGRCADYILRELKPFRIFVYADKETRMERCRKKGNEHLSDRQLWRNICSVDKNRSGYYAFYTGQKWGDKLNYDMCINTAETDIKVIVSALLKMIE